MGVMMGLNAACKGLNRIAAKSDEVWNGFWL
jgi:hypothetical protein